MEVRIINDSTLWNGFLERQPHGHLLQTFEWGELLHSLGNNVIRLGAFDGERLVGTMMLSVADAPLPKPLSLLHLKWIYCGRGPTIEASSREALAALLAEAHAIARRERAIMLRLEPNISEEEDKLECWSRNLRLAGCIENPHSIHGRRSWVLDTTPDLDEIFQNFNKKWRQNTRQAERRGVTVREGTSEADFDTFYELLHATSEQQKFYIHPKSYYQRIFRTFIRTGKGVLLVAEHNQQIIGVNVLIRFGNRCWDMFSASRDKRSCLNESYLLQYHCFKWAKEQGCAHFDFRTIPQVLEPGEEMWGVYEFKKGFGGYSVLNIATHDYVYRPVLYRAWSTIVERRRAKRRQDHRQKVVIRAC